MQGGSGSKRHCFLCKIKHAGKFVSFPSSDAKGHLSVWRTALGLDPELYTAEKCRNMQICSKWLPPKFHRANPVFVSHTLDGKKQAPLPQSPQAARRAGRLQKAAVAAVAQKNSHYDRLVGQVVAKEELIARTRKEVADLQEEMERLGSELGKPSLAADILNDRRLRELFSFDEFCRKMTSFPNKEDLDEFVELVRATHSKNWNSRRKCSFWFAVVATLTRKRTAIGYTAMAHLLPDTPAFSSALKSYVAGLLPSIADVCSTISPALTEEECVRHLPSGHADIRTCLRRAVACQEGTGPLDSYSRREVGQSQGDPAAYLLRTAH